MARSDDAETRAARWEKEAHDLSTQVAFLQEELALVRRKLTESPRHVRQLEERLAATSGAAGQADREQRAAGRHAQGGACPDRDAQGGDRPARPAAQRLRRVPRAARGRHGRRVHRRSQAACRHLPGAGGGRAAPRPGGPAQRRAQHRRRVRLRAGRRGRDAQGAPGEPDRRQGGPGAGHLARRRGAGGPPRGQPGRRRAARRRLAAHRAAQRVRLRAGTEERGRGAGPGGGAGRRLQRHRRPALPDRADPRRGRAAVPARRPVPRAPAAPAEGRPALRPARLRQDADRQGGGQLAGQEDRRAPGRGEAHQLLPQHQGPGAAQQVRRRDRAAHPPDLPAGPGEGRRGHPGDRVLRRDGLGLPHPRLRRLLGRREHDRSRSSCRRSTAWRGWRTSS